ncbi:unnamed protein product [Lactuca virosa]|uniref:HORMA domain-containing protein n=1 Tax=Lactuca virosa TaxID=75947 RepID=A0AAU9PM67_9ASTR|nr:unnamed protein product [Lactuca virosa]
MACAMINLHVLSVSDSIFPTLVLESSVSNLSSLSTANRLRSHLFFIQNRHLLYSLALFPLSSYFGGFKIALTKLAVRCVAFSPQSQREKDKMDCKENESPKIVEFLEVAITSIIFLKGIYPPGVFERRRYMNLLVHRARHPQLHHYILNSVNALEPYIQQGLVERVAVIFFKDDRIPVERFMFKINVNLSCYDGEMMDMELRSFLVKLSLSEPFSKNAAVVSQCKKSDWRWEITGYFCSLPEAQIGAWISSNTHQWKQPSVITPIKSMNIEPLSVQLYLEHPPLKP